MANRSNTKIGSRGTLVDLSRPSQRLAAEASLLKPPDTPTEGLLLGGNLSDNKLVKSAVRFDDAKQEASKGDLKKQKQAWESPLDMPRSPRILSPVKHRAGSKKVSLLCHLEKNGY